MFLRWTLNLAVSTSPPPTNRILVPTLAAYLYTPPKPLLISQTPEEYLDYQLNWIIRGLSPGETIVASSWAASSPDFVITNESFTTTTTTAWVTEGIPGNYYAITNTVITSGGREMQETITYQCIPQRLT